MSYTLLIVTFLTSGGWNAAPLLSFAGSSNAADLCGDAIKAINTIPGMGSYNSDAAKYNYNPQYLICVPGAPATRDGQ